MTINIKWHGRNNRFGQTKTGRAYEVCPKRNGKFWVEASLPGGARHPLPYNEHDSITAAQKWAEEYEGRLCGARTKDSATEDDEEVLSWF